MQSWQNLYPSAPPLEEPPVEISMTSVTQETPPSDEPGEPGSGSGLSGACAWFYRAILWMPCSKPTTSIPGEVSCCLSNCWASTLNPPTVPIRFRDISPEVMEAHTVHGVGSKALAYRFWYIYTCVMALWFLWSWLSDGMTLWVLWQHEDQYPFGVAWVYSFATLLDLVYFWVQGRKAVRTVETDLIADTFLSMEAYQHYVLRFGYRKYCVLAAIEQTKSWRDHLALLVYFRSSRMSES